MQRFTCPFCGLRDEREFSFAGESGKTRPDTAAEVSDADWSAYLFTGTNPRGRTDEIWVHTPCQEYFRMIRDTVTMEVLETVPLRRDPS
ncbi:sarcosine oxidase subunit delta [Chachezhania sediminis]|uniref:sarcosine oxidase subunit delta n=1 Tax=Chachezhania sediminis TaxID=2599291 RepID=UPI00131D2FA7|nr:sarcosine oxidase subunit delta [Chachezhania sediminis]